MAALVVGAGGRAPPAQASYTRACERMHVCVCARVGIVSRIDGRNISWS